MHITPQQQGKPPAGPAAVYSSSTPDELDYSRCGTQLESVGSTGHGGARQDTPVPFAALPPSAAAHNGQQHHMGTDVRHVQQQSSLEPEYSAHDLSHPMPPKQLQLSRPAVLQYGAAAAAGDLAAPRPAAAVSLGGGASPEGSNSSGDTFMAAAAGRPPAAPRRQPLAGPAASLYRADASSVMKVMAALQAGRLLPPSGTGAAPAAGSAAGIRCAAEPEGPLHQSRPRLPMLTLQGLQSSSRLLSSVAAPAAASASSSSGSSSSRAAGGWPLAATATTAGLNSNQFSRAAAILATHHGPAGSKYPFRSGGAAASRQHTRFATAPGAGRELHNFSSNQPDASGKQPAGGGVDQQWWQPLSTAAAGAARDALHTSHGPWWRDPLPFRPNAAGARQQAQPLAEQQVLHGSPVHYLDTTAAAAAGAVGAPAGGHGISSAHCAGILPPLGLQQASEGDLSPRALPPPPQSQHSDRHEGASRDRPSALQLLSRAYQQRPVTHPSRVVTTELPLPAAPGRPLPAADQPSSMGRSSGKHGISSSSDYTAGASDLSTSTWVAPSAAAKTAGVRLAARAGRDTSALGVRLPSSLYSPPSPAAPATAGTEHGHTSPSHISSTSSLSAPSQQLSHGELQAMVDAVLGPLRQEVEASRRHVAAKLQEEAPHSSYARWALDHQQRQQMLAPTAAVDGHISSSQGGYSYSQQVAARVWEEPGGLRQKYGRPSSQQSISSRASSRASSGSDSDFQQLEQSQLQCQQDLSHAIDLALEQLGSMSVSATSAAAPGSNSNASAAQQHAAEMEAGLEQELQELSQMIEVLREKFEMQDSQQLPRQRRSSSRGGGLAPPQRSYDVAPYPSYTSGVTAAAAAGAAGGRGASGGAAATTSLTSGSVCQRPGSASSAATSSSEDEVADTAQSRRVAAALAACLTRETPPGRSAGPAPSHATHLRWRHQAQQREAQEAAQQGLGRVYGRDGRPEMLAAQAGGQPLQQPAARRRLVWGEELPQRPL